MIANNLRKLTLWLCTHINENLIALSYDPEQASLKSKLVQTTIALIVGSCLDYDYSGNLNGTNIFFEYISKMANNLEYSFQSFQDILSASDLTNDFKTMIEFLN